MALLSRLRERSSAIVGRWQRDTLATYPDDASVAFQRNKDPFTNPVGNTLRTGTEAAVEALLDGSSAEEVGTCLSEFIKIRAVQDFAPSQALCFVFLLKEAIRSELGRKDRDSSSNGELAELEMKIDRVALRAFDIFLGYRQQVYELRINEVKRSVGDWVERMNRRRPRSRADEELDQSDTSTRSDAQRGDGQ